MTGLAAFALRHWKLIGVGLIIAFLASYSAYQRGQAVKWHNAHDKAVAAHQRDLVTIKLSMQQAIADNAAKVIAKERAAAAITERTNDELQSDLVDARALAADYARRMRVNRTCASDSGQAGNTEIASAPSDSATAGGETFVSIPSDDLRICADNTVKAQSWADWYRELRDQWNKE